MTNSQITEVLSQFGYSTGEWIDLSRITMIYLDIDCRIYSDIRHRKFYFDNTNGLLRIVDGVTKRNGTFLTNEGDEVANGDSLGSVKASHLYDYSVILGFVRTSMMMPNGQIMYR